MDFDSKISLRKLWASKYDIQETHVRSAVIKVKLF